jgi:endonuclease/exonuclease/phosphatase family metal-dependent hydrolase
VSGQPTSDDVALTVATLNTMGLPVLGSGLPRRYQAIGSWFERFPVDVVLCQEVFTHYHRALLTRHLPSYTAHYQRSLAGPAGGLVIFARERALATTYRSFPRRSRYGLRPAQRLRSQLKGTTVAVFGTPAPVAVINTHLLANTADDWSDGSRTSRAQAAQLADLGRIVGAQDCPVIVAGDFNMPATAPAFRAFLAGAGLADTFGGACPPTFRARFLPPGTVPHCIDFILGPDGVQVEDHGVLFADDSAGIDSVSDHLGLYATLTIGRVAGGLTDRDDGIHPRALPM